MKANKVLLVQPNYSQQKKYTKYSISPPLGLAYIAAALEKNGINVEILDTNALNLNVQDVIQRAKDIQADIVGVSILMTGYRYGVEIARRLPKNILSVCGGAYPSSVPEQILEDGFNVAVKGRGEQPMLDLASGQKIDNIPGIYYRKNKKIYHNPPYAVKDLGSDPLLLPARHLLINNGVNLPYQLAGTMYFPWAPIF
ncbi:MAG: cobalamin B12-binding domain-containing protein, partial [Patescibacteria group bacterium]